MLQVDYTHWKEPRVMVKVMLEYFKAHRDTEILLLFQLLRALCGRFVADLQFLRDFLENEVGKQKQSSGSKETHFSVLPIP